VHARDQQVANELGSSSTMTSLANPDAVIR